MIWQVTYFKNQQIGKNQVLICCSTAFIRVVILGLNAEQYKSSRRANLFHNVLATSAI